MRLVRNNLSMRITKYAASVSQQHNQDAWFVDATCPLCDSQLVWFEPHDSYLYVPTEIVCVKYYTHGTRCEYEQNINGLEVAQIKADLKLNWDKQWEFKF